MARGSKRLRRFIADMDLDVVSLDESTRTSQMAADALGCTVGQIAKSIVFTGEPLLSSSSPGTSGWI